MPRTPVTFANRQGLTLFGILETPAGPAASNLAVLLLSPGVKMRVGPQCLYRHMADAFLEMGITVLRFDWYGLGDSEGALPEELLRDLYNHTEVGRFIDDTIDAMDWMQREHGIRRFIAAGLCGGAMTGLLAAERDPRIAGFLGIGPPAVLSSRAADASKYMTRGQLDQMRGMYLRRLLNPKAWFRLLTFQADYSLIGRVIVRTLRQGATEPAAAPAPAADDNANPRLPSAFFAMLESARPMLLVYGGADRLQWEFEEKFVARHKAQLDALPRGYDVHVVANANHVLSATEWQQEMLGVSRDWLRRHFGSSLPALPALPAQSTMAAARS